jgi:tellurite resistance protein TerC
MIWFWLGFLSLVTLFLALDLGVFHRKAHAVSMREGLIWSAVWATTALLFSIFVYHAYDKHWLGLGVPDPGGPPEAMIDGATAWTLYITCYLLEWSLSVDNLFVIALIFGYFKIPPIHQHRVLFWGIIGAIVMRGFFIALGVTIVEKFHYILYAFGVFLIFTAYKMLSSDGDPDPSKSRVVRLIYRNFRVTSELHGSSFLVRLPDPDGSVKVWLTPLALALIVVEVTDLVFAVDSIPAAFAVLGRHADSFLLFTSNIFAILGLRSMFFALAGLLGKFHYLKVSLAIILALIGVKMLLTDWIRSLGITPQQTSYVTLALIVILLAAGVIASLVWSRKVEQKVVSEVEAG